MRSRQEQELSIQRTPPHLDRADIVIIGNGIAGLTAAVEARHLAPDKRIVVITEQIHPTIHTPALKQFALGKLTRDQLLAYPAGTERAERIHVVTARVEEIHAQSKYIVLNGGRGFGYDSLLIATGSTPRGLAESLPGRDFDGVLTLHRLQDYLNLRRRIGEVSEAVVVGGGAHAIETVMALRHQGIQVNWLIRGNTFMSRILDEGASSMVLSRIRRAGVAVYTETEAVGVVGRIGSVVGVITNHQEMIPCQLVLICTGTQPVSMLAQRCTLPMRYKNGILVDDQLHTSVRDIYAAGDVAALRNPFTGNYETRAQWYAAVSQGRTAAAVMTGYDELARQPFGVQWHATHLGELSMLTIGDPLSSSEKVVPLTDTSQRGYRRMAIVDDRLVGYLSLGAAQPDSLAIKRIIDEGHSIRNITKALLKGTFDARKYLSRQHTYAAHSVLTGKLPSPSFRNPVSQVQLLQLVEPSAAQPQAPGALSLRETDALPQIERETKGTMRQIRQVQIATQQEYYVSQTEPIERTALPQSAYEVEEEISPFTGKLPAIPTKVVESTLVPVLTGPATTSKLWSYIQETASTDEREQENRSSMPTRRNSGSLWAYGNRSNSGNQKREQ